MVKYFALVQLVILYQFRFKEYGIFPILNSLILIIDIKKLNMEIMIINYFFKRDLTWNSTLFKAKFFELWTNYNDFLILSYNGINCPLNDP